MVLLGSESLSHKLLSSENNIFLLDIDHKYLLRIRKNNTAWYIDVNQFKTICKEEKIKLRNNIPVEYIHNFYWTPLYDLLSKHNLEKFSLVFAYINDSISLSNQNEPTQQIDASLINNIVARFENRLSSELSSIHHVLQSRTVAPKPTSADEHYLAIFRSKTNDHLYYFFRIQFKSLSSRIAKLQGDPRFPGGLELLRYFQTPNAIRLFNSMILKFSDYLVRQGCCTVLRKPGLWSEKKMIEQIYLFYDMPYVADTVTAPLPPSEKVVTPLQPGESRDYLSLQTDQCLLSD